MNKLIGWIKNNKIAFIVILILIYFAYPKNAPRFISPMLEGFGSESGGAFPTRNGDSGIAPAMLKTTTLGATPTDRKVITSSWLSVQVKNVQTSVSQIKSRVATLSGFIVNIETVKPEFGESATISARVPASQVDSYMAYIKGNAVKVVSENLSGNDITDEFIDLQAHLTDLTAEKASLVALLNKAVTADEILNVHQAIVQIQNEMDAIQGQIKYMNQAANMSLVTVYISTDELSLPYVPEMSWRPQVIFKNALRSLLVTIQAIGSGLIWIAVYSVIIVPALTIVFVIYLVRRRKQNL